MDPELHIYKCCKCHIDLYAHFGEKQDITIICMPCKEKVDKEPK